MFWLKKLTSAGVAFAAVALIVIGVWAVTGTGDRAEAQPPSPADPKNRLTELDQEIESLTTRIKVLEDQKTRLKLAGGTLELTVGSGQPSLEVKELDTTGKVLLRVWPADLDALKRFLARSHSDRDGPRRLVAVVEPSYPADRVKEVFAVCRATGYEPETAKQPAANAPYEIETPDVLRIEVGLTVAGRRVPAPREPITGGHIVRPDGTVSLGANGSVRVRGLTLPEAETAIRNHLLGTREVKKLGVGAEGVNVSVDVLTCVSRFFYVITTGPDGERVTRLPSTGSDCVLDVLGTEPWKSAVVGNPEIFIARPDPAGKEDQLLSVDWKEITQQGITHTNYQLFPGDRITIKARK